MTDSYPGLPFPRRIVAIVAVFIGSLLLMIDASIANIVLPTIAKDLHVEGASTVLLVTVYQLVLAMTLLPFAALGERIGHRRLCQGGLLLHGIGAIACFFTHSLGALIAVRALQSFGSAAALSVAVGLVRAIYPVRRLGVGLGINTIANAGGTALAPVVSGIIISVADWHWVFVAIVPLSLILLSLSRFLPDPEPREHAFDLLGAGLCALTFGLVIAGLESAIHSRYLFVSIGVVASGLVVARFFVRYEKRASDPVLPLDVLAIPVIALTITAAFIAVLASMALLLSMPFRLQQGYGFSPAEVGAIMAAYAAVTGVVAPTSGFLSDRIPVPLMNAIGMTIASVGLLLIALLPAHPVHFDIVWRLGLCALGFGMFYAPSARLVVAAAPALRAAAAGSLYTTSRMVGQATSATMVAALLAFGVGEGPVPALVAMCLTLFAGAISVFNLRLVKRGASTPKLRST